PTAISVRAPVPARNLIRRALECDVARLARLIAAQVERRSRIQALNGYTVVLGELGGGNVGVHDRCAVRWRGAGYRRTVSPMRQPCGVAEFMREQGDLVILRLPVAIR